ncbi:MAG TPA: L,D-transpeptidase family protein [Verrucomicrobiae bacterium]|jgi:lipoprotein-anchoring transpeptidase ErfK/SrfK|nr:L,D-transpeptidase family protein [Verrucomicrobiae bacterium]
MRLRFWTFILTFVLIAPAAYAAPAPESRPAAAEAKAAPQDPVPSRTPAPKAPDFRSLLEQARALADQKNWDDSEALYLKITQSPVVEDRIKAYEGLIEVYNKLRFSKKAGRVEKKLEEEKKFVERLVPAGDSYYQKYTVRKGDTYGKIAARNGISQKWLERANSGKLLKADDEILLPRTRYELVVDKASKTLTWKRGEEVIKTYSVSVGREGMETPEGEFRVEHKVKDPVWYWMKKEIPAGSVKNLLGTRWLGLNHKGYGIHGTRNPKSIGAAMSHGCIRMHNQDVEEIFPWIPVGTPVIIQNGAASPRSAG